MTNPRPESSPTPSHLPKLCMRKHLFQNNSCCFRNYTTEVSLHYGTTPRGECVGEPSKTVMVFIRNDLLDRLPTPFSGNSSCEIPFKNVFVFLSIFHVMHSPNFYATPVHMKCIMPFQSFSTNISICIYSQIYNYTTCNSTISIVTQISSLELNTISSPMAYTHHYIPYNCDIILTHQALTY